LLGILVSKLAQENPPWRDSSGSSIISVEQLIAGEKTSHAEEAHADFRRGGL
jgi:hypothetical protein